MDLTPDNGPVTGETLLDIHGIDFINTEDVIVRLPNLFLSIFGFAVSLHQLGFSSIGLEHSAHVLCGGVRV